MSLKSRRGSHNLKFGGQTIPDAGGSNFWIVDIPSLYSRAVHIIRTI